MGSDFNPGMAHQSHDFGRTDDLRRSFGSRDCFDNRNSGTSPHVQFKQHPFMDSDNDFFFSSRVFRRRSFSGSCSQHFGRHGTEFLGLERTRVGSKRNLVSHDFNRSNVRRNGYDLSEKFPFRNRNRISFHFIDFRHIHRPSDYKRQRTSFFSHSGRRKLSFPLRPGDHGKRS